MSAANTPSSLAEFEEILCSGIDPVSVPSVAYGIARGNETLLIGAAGFADKELGVLATSSTPYALASVTKPMTATAIAVLAERGLVDLDAPINEYLGDSKVIAMVGNADDATIRRAANHSAGLPMHHQYFYEDEPYRRPAFDETIRRYCRLFSPPGERYLYSNLGFGLLDYVIERVSGQSYGQFMAEEVFAPLGMAHASIGGTVGRARSYGGDGVAYPPYGFDHPGASEAFGSVEDLLVFGRFHLGHGAALLSPENRVEMQRSTMNVSGANGYGLGWAINEDRFGLRFISHSGGMSGVNTLLRLVPELDLVIVILVNGESNLPFEGADNALAALIPSFRERLIVERLAPKPESVKIAVPSELRREWSGFVDTYNGELPLAIEYYGRT